MAHPSSNAPREQQPWVRDVEQRLKAAEETISRLTDGVRSASRKADGVASVAQSTQEQVVVVAAAAAAAQSTANQALRQPGDQLFDRRAYLEQNMALWDAIRIEEYTWLADGISFSVPADANNTTGNYIKVKNLDTIAISPSTGGTMRIEYDATLPNPAVPPGDPTDVIYLTMDWRDAQGNQIFGYTSGVGQTETGHHVTTALVIPPTAASVRLGFEARRAEGQTTAINVSFRNPSVTLSVPSSTIDWDGSSEIPVTSLPSYAQTPGVGANYFDTLPLLPSAANGRTDAQRLKQDFYTEGVSAFETITIGPNFIEFTITAGSAAPTGDRIIMNKELIRIDPGDTLSNGSSFARVVGAGATTATVRFGHVADWYDENKNYISRSLSRSNAIPATTTSVTTSLTGGFAFEAPANARYVRVGSLLVMDAKPNSTPFGTLIMTLYNPRNYLAVTTRMLTPASVNASILADLSVSEIKLQDSSVITPKLADLAVTNGKIGPFAVSLPKVDSTVRNRMFFSGIFDYYNPLRGTGTYVENVGSATWWSLPVVAPSGTYTGIVQENTLNDGAAATVSGNRLIAPVSGKYFMTATVGFYANTTGTARAIAFQVGTSATGNRKGQTVMRYATMPGADVWANSSAVIKANAGDILSVVARQDSTGTLSVGLESLQVVYLGPA